MKNKIIKTIKKNKIIKTINLSENNYRRLLELQIYFYNITGKKPTMDEVVGRLIRNIDENE